MGEEEERIGRQRNEQIAYDDGRNDDSSWLDEMILIKYIYL